MDGHAEADCAAVLNWPWDLPRRHRTPQIGDAVTEPPEAVGLFSLCRALRDELIHVPGPTGTMHHQRTDRFRPVMRKKLTLGSGPRDRQAEQQRRRRRFRARVAPDPPRLAWLARPGRARTPLMVMIVRLQQASRGRSRECAARGTRTAPEERVQRGRNGRFSASFGEKTAQPARRRAANFRRFSGTAAFFRRSVCPERTPHRERASGKNFRDSALFSHVVHSGRRPRLLASPLL